MRYGSKAMEIFFAALNLLSITFMVLIVVALSKVMQQTLELSNVESLVLIIGFVFSYTFWGGTYAHAYTNTLQGVLMTLVALLLVGSGLHLFGDGFAPVVETMAAQDPNLVAAANPDSSLFGTFFVVWVSGFIIGFALVCQPHIIIKPLYLKTEKQVWRALAVAIVVSTIFTAVLLVGVYVHLMDLPADALLDAQGNFDQDLVVPAYINSFSPVMQAIITVVLLAVGMSTLDGILVALSSIAGNDLFLNLTKNNLLAHKSDAERSQLARYVSQGVLVAMGITTFVIALDPPMLVGIFGQLGVYGIVATSAVPIAFGIFSPALGKKTIFPAAITAAVVYVGLTAWFYSAARSEPPVDLNAVVEQNGLAFLFDTGAVQLGMANPSVPATYAILASVVVAISGLIYTRVRQ